MFNNACLYGEKGVLEKTFSGENNVQCSFLKSKLWHERFVIIFIESALRISKGARSNGEEIYSNFSKIVNSIENSIELYELRTAEPEEVVKVVEADEVWV